MIVRHALELVGFHNNLCTDDDKNSVVVHCNKYLRYLEYKTVGGKLLPHRDGFKVCEDTGTKSTHTLLLFLSDCKLGGETLIMDDEGNKGNNWSKETNLVMDTYENRREDDHSNSNTKVFNKRRIRYVKHNNQVDTFQEDGKTPKIKVFRLRDASIRSAGISGREKKAGSEDEAEIPPLRHISAGIQPSEGRILLFPHHWPHAGAVVQSVPKIALRAELAIFRV